MNIYWLWPAVAVVTFVLTWMTMRFAEKRRLLDFPNDRSAHDHPVPRGGGAAIVLTFMAGTVIAASYGLADGRLHAAILGGGGLVALTGLSEDYRGVSVRLRVVLHFLSAACALYWLGGIPENLLPGVPPALMQVLGVLSIVWFINLYNFMDGIDGIAGIETVTVCIGGVVLYAGCMSDGTTWVLPALLMAAVTGFLFWNFPAARIFLGDTGSGFLGFMMAVFCVQAANLESALFWAWIILLGVFIVDSGVTLVRRMLRRQRLQNAHRNHAYQFAARRFGGHTPVTIAVGAINLFWLLPIALLVGTGHAPAVALLPVAYAPLVWLAIHFKAGASELQEL